MKKTEFIPYKKMEEKHWQKLQELSGKMVRMASEGRDIEYMSKQLNMPPQQINNDFMEILRVVKHQVGIKNFIKALFTK